MTPGSHPLPGTVGETAAEVDRRGGKGVAVPVDHGVDEEVAALFEQVEREQGRLDVLINNAFSLPEDLTDPLPFWEKPLSNWEMVDVGVRSSYVAAWHAARIMVPQRSGLLVATSGYVGVTYTYGVVFGLCKAAVDRMARDMAIELAPHGVASLSLWLSLAFTERARRNLESHPEMTSQTVTNPGIGSSIEFPGRVIAALAADPEIMTRSGATCIAAELAHEYGIRVSTARSPLRFARSAALRSTPPCPGAGAFSWPRSIPRGSNTGSTARTSSTASTGSAAGWTASTASSSSRRSIPMP